MLTVVQGRLSVAVRHDEFRGKLKYNIPTLMSVIDI